MTDISVVLFKGWKLDPKKVDDADIDWDVVEQMQNDPDYVFLEDDMCGQWALFGARMAYGYQNGGSTGFDFEEVNPPSQTDFDIANRFYQFTRLDIHDFLFHGQPKEARIMIHTVIS
jgi:hypothetical protein